MASLSNSAVRDVYARVGLKRDCKSSSNDCNYAVVKRPFTAISCVSYGLSSRMRIYSCLHEAWARSFFAKLPLLWTLYAGANQSRNRCAGGHVQCLDLPLSVGRGYPDKGLMVTWRFSGTLWKLTDRFDFFLPVALEVQWSSSIPLASAPLYILQPP